MHSNFPGEYCFIADLGRGGHFPSRADFSSRVSLLFHVLLLNPQLTGQGLGFSNTDFPAFVQKFLNKRVIGGFFGNMLHKDTLAAAQAACHPQIIAKEMPAVHSMTNAGKDFTKSSTAFICVKNGLIKSKGRALGPSHKA